MLITRTYVARLAATQHLLSSFTSTRSSVKIVYNYGHCYLPEYKERKKERKKERNFIFLLLADTLEKKINKISFFLSFYVLR